MVPEQWLKTCPLCGGHNQCAMTAGQPAGTCWCATATFSAEALAAVPPDSMGKRCLCAGCGLTEGESPDER
jgi:hypothetical protein